MIIVRNGVWHVIDHKLDTSETHSQCPSGDPALQVQSSYFSTDNIIQERFYIFRSFAPVMARSPIPKEPPTMDLTLTLVSELSVLVTNQLHVAGLKTCIPICIKKRRGTPELYNNYCRENSLGFMGDFGDLPIDQIF